MTGGSRGIGRAVALGAARQGAQVVVGYRAQQAAAAAVVAGVRAAGGRALACRADVAAPAAAVALVEQTLAAFGRLDAMVLAAGEALQELLLDTEPAHWQRQLQVHLLGPARLVSAALPHLAASGGAVLLVSSIWGRLGAAAETAYSAAKAGVIGLGRDLAVRAAPLGVRVNVLLPGVIETDMLADLTVADRAELAAATAVGRLGTPDDVAAAALFLISPRAAYITGQALAVDGGFWPGSTSGV